MSKLENTIEALLLYKNEPVSRKELAKLLKRDVKEVEEALTNLKSFYQDRGVVLVDDGEAVMFGTHPSESAMIEEIRKEELSRDLGRAGLETLAIVLYRGPVTRREIDFIRGVNSSFILRSLLIRGLVERSDIGNERGYSYKPTLELLRHLGISSKEELPEYGSALKKLETFITTTEDIAEDVNK